MYNFSSHPDRRKTGSSKYAYMKLENPNVDPNAIPMSVADMEFCPAPEIVEGLKDYLDDCVLGYAIADDSYISAVKSFLKKRHGLEIKREWLHNTPGVVNALFVSVRAFTEKGDGVIIMNPVYPPFTAAITVNERKLVHCPLIEKDMYYEIDFEKFEKLASAPENKVLIFCSPANPVGRIWKREELEKLAEICVKNELYVVCDEIWNDFELYGNKHVCIHNVNEDLRKRLVTCTAPSKTFNIAGLCCSNIIIPDEETGKKFREQAEAMKSVSVNILGFEACKLAYEKCEHWLEEMLKVIEINMDYAVREISTKLPKARLRKPEGTFVLWCDMNAYEKDCDSLKKRLEEKSCFVSQGFTFGPGGEGFVRINVGLPHEELKREITKFISCFSK